MKVIKFDDKSGDLGLLRPDDIVANLGLKEGDNVELIEGPNGTVIVPWPENKQNADGESGAT